MTLTYAIITNIYSNATNLSSNTISEMNYGDYKLNYGNTCNILLTSSYEVGLCPNSSTISECCDYIADAKGITYNYCNDNRIYNCIYSNNYDTTQIIYGYLNNFILWTFCIVVVLLVLICLIMSSLYLFSKTLNSSNNNNYQEINN